MNVRDNIKGPLMGKVGKNVNGKENFVKFGQMSQKQNHFEDKYNNANIVYGKFKPTSKFTIAKRSDSINDVNLIYNDFNENLNNIKI